MDFREYARILRGGWIIILAFIVLGAGAGAGFAATAEKQYQATSQVFVAGSSTGSAPDAVAGSSYALAQVGSYMNLVSTPSVLRPVITRLGLATSIGDLQGRVSAAVVDGTSLISITATDPDPRVAVALANQTADSLDRVVTALESRGAGARPPVELSVVERAIRPTAPSSPRPLADLLLGLLLGLAFGVTVVLARSALDTKLRSERDVRSVTTAPILGGIAFEPPSSDRARLVSADPNSPRAESLRSLRTNLQFLDLGVGNSFVITSSVPGEGKSTTAADLAIAVGAAGSRVVLVDADLRRPSIADCLGIEGGAGLTDVLIGRADLDDVVQPWGAGGMHVLPAGRIPPNPSELLGSAAMMRLMGQLSEEYDMVIYDAPPLLPVTDAAVLSAAASATVVLVAVGRTRRNELASALDAVERVGARVGGVVLSMLPARGPNAAVHTRYGYSYAAASPGDPEAPVAILADPYPEEELVEHRR